MAENVDLDAERTHIEYNEDGKTGRGYRDSVRPKNKFESQGEVGLYRTVVLPAMMYGAETWAVKKAQEKKLDVAEMMIL